MSGLINRVATLFKGFLRPRLFRYAKGMEDKMTALSNATAFRLARPLRQQTSVIFSSPHSGRAYSRDFLAAADLHLPTLQAPAPLPHTTLDQCRLRREAPPAAALTRHHRAAGKAHDRQG